MITSSTSDKPINPHLVKYREKYQKYPYLSIFILLIKKLRLYLLSCIIGKDLKQSYQRRNFFDRYWIILLLQDYRLHKLLSEGYGKKIPFWDGTELCVIDKKIAPIVFCLNNMGIITNYSCEGNEEKGHSYQPYFTTAPGYQLPKELLTFLQEKEIIYKFEKVNNSWIGESLYNKNIDNMDLFLECVNEWAYQHGTPNADILKRLWKYSQ